MDRPIIRNEGVEESQQRAPVPWASARVWLLTALLGLAVFALGFPDRLLTHLAYAVERGRIQAGTEELTAADALTSTFRLVARVARPGVVHISVSGGADQRALLAQLEEDAEALERESQSLRGRQERGGSERPSFEEFEELLKKQAELLKRRDDIIERLHGGTGSGIVFDDQGYILTNNHVVAGRGDIRVRFSDRREMTATLVGADEDSDLAMIKVNTTEVHPLEFGDSDALEVGDWVMAVGAPFGLDQTVTHGIVSAKGRSDIFTGGRRRIVYQDFIQTDAAINPGNSGGPLVNMRGEVVGVNTAIATQGDGQNAGVAFTIPSNLARKIGSQLRDSGEVVRGWLGIRMGELTQEDYAVLGITQPQGIVVDGVIQGTPAARAGLLVDDVVLSVDGKVVERSSQVLALIAGYFPGEKATFEVLRDGVIRKLTVELSRRPAETELSQTEVMQGRPLDAIDAFVRTYRPSFPFRTGFDEDERGVFVLGLEDDADDSLQRGMLIVAANGTQVQTIGDLVKALGSGATREARLEVRSGDGDVRTITVPLRR